VVMVHHTSKKPADQKDTSYDALDMRGSSAFFGKADGVIMITPKGAETERRALIKTIFKRGTGWTKEVCFAIYGNKEAKVWLNKLAENALTLIRAGGHKLEELAAQLNCGPSALREALRALEDNNLIKRNGIDSWALKK